MHNTDRASLVYKLFHAWYWYYMHACRYKLPFSESPLTARVSSERSLPVSGPGPGLQHDNGPLHQIVDTKGLSSTPEHELRRQRQDCQQIFRLRLVNPGCAGNCFPGAFLSCESPQRYCIREVCVQFFLANSIPKQVPWFRLHRC